MSHADERDSTTRRHNRAVTKPGLLFVGNFLSGSGTHQTYVEALTDRLECRQWRIVRTSRRRRRLERLADMLHTVWTRRDDYSIAHIDLFSGLAFVWAEAVCFALRRLAKPYVVTLRGGNLPLFATRWPARTRRLLRSAALVTAPSGYLGNVFGHNARELIEIPNAIDLSSYSYRRRAGAGMRLIWVRAFHAVYNPVLAVETLALLQARFPLTTLTMIGADKGDGSILAVQQRARVLGVAEKLHVIPGVPKREIPDHLANGDIFLNTADVDNSPVSVVEALATGLCVVSTGVGGIPFLLRDQVDSLLVPPRDSIAMARAVMRLLDEPELAARLSTGARAVAERHDWAHVIERWESMFRRVVTDA